MAFTVWLKWHVMAHNSGDLLAGLSAPWSVGLVFGTDSVQGTTTDHCR